MKPEAQAHAIAKVMDWEYYEETAEMVATEDGDIVGYSWPSLDAMHEAEKWWFSTNPKVPFSYSRNLEEIVDRDWEEGMPDCQSVCFYCATAAQRAESFLRALNLWTE